MNVWRVTSFVFIYESISGVHQMEQNENTDNTTIHCKVILFILKKRLHFKTVVDPNKLYTST